MGSRGFDTSSNVQGLGKTQGGYVHMPTPNFLVYEIHILDIQFSEPELSHHLIQDL